MRTILTMLGAWAALAAAPALAPAQQWSSSAIFPEKAHDFGTVARGSKLRYAFRLVNTTKYDIHIADWRTKCGCTGVNVGARDIPPGTQTEIEATLDTSKFVGYKPSGLTLIIDRPVYEEIDLNLTCFIRGDVLLDPGQVDFGLVRRGSSPSLTLNLNYLGGRADWQVTEIHTISPNLTAELREVGRSPSGQSQYTLKATLAPATPEGEFKDEITLLTNDPASPRIPISVAARVQGAVVVAPATLNLGRLRPGAVVTRDVLVRGGQPFKITAAEGDGGLSIPKVPDASAPLHRITVRFQAPDRPGPYHEVLEVGTDLDGDHPARLTAFATIVP